MIHTITSLQHPLVKHLNKLRLDSDYRYEQQSLVLDGHKPIQEIDPSAIRQLICTEAWNPIPFTAPETWIVSESIMKKISGMSSPEGMMAEVKMPPFKALDHLSFVLALDGISDPGNLGTLLRTALALGWEGVYLLPGCCDPFNDKALRAARGAHFRISLAGGSVENLDQLIQKNRWEPLVADLKGQKPEELGRVTKRLLVLGNEAHGASTEVKNLCKKVTIPMPGEMESLNVAIAGGILMYILKG